MTRPTPDRRDFLRSALSVGAVASVGLSASGIVAWAAAAPIKLAHREGNMLRASSPGVYELASKIPGISGIEVQTTRSNLWDRDTVLAYKRESLRWNIRTVSMGGSLPASGTLLDAGPCEQSLRKTIRAGEILGVGVVLVPGFRETCPKMDDEASYGPVVPESMVHNNEGIKGIEVLGAGIVQMHLKNNREPLMEVPGLVDWSKAWPAIRKSGFDGWFAFETPHASPEACIEETRKNVAWVMKNQA